jgi:hypothetical protein
MISEEIFDKFKNFIKTILLILKFNY